MKTYDFYAKSMPENKKNFTELLSAIKAQKLFYKLSYILLGFLSARGSIFGGYIPFSCALISCVPIKDMLFCSAGVVVGCFFPNMVNDSFRYIATIIAIMAVRWILEDIKILKNKTYFTIILSTLPLLTTGIAMSFTGSKINATLLLMYTSEALISAVSAYFFSKTINVFETHNGIHNLNQQDLACVVLSFYISILSLTGITIGGISIGRVLAVGVILYCAYFGGVYGGALCGTVSGMILSLQNVNFDYFFTSYAFSGLIAGMFAPVGKLAVAVGFVLSNGILSMQNSTNSNILNNAYEIFIASVIFMVIPRKYVSKLKVLFDNENITDSFDNIKQSAIIRLEFVSETLSAICLYVENVAKRMNKLSLKSDNEIQRCVTSKICSRCGIKDICLKKEYDQTTEILHKAITLAKRDKKINESCFPKSFVKRCSRIERICDMIPELIRQNETNKEANTRAQKMREIVNTQFLTTEQILCDVCSDIEGIGEVYPRQSSEIKALFEKHGIAVKEVVCRTDENNHMFLQIEFTDSKHSFALSKDLFADIQRICTCKMNPPTVITGKETSKIMFSQLSDFEVSYSLKQHICNSGSLCGDCFKSVDDGEGGRVFILSDGMGSGGRAAVDGTMAAGISAKLIQSGLSFESTLHIVNSSVLMKSGDESFATLDIVRVDTYSGKTEFLKAGAATSFVRRKDKIIKVETPGLPVGILSDVSFSKTKLNLSDDDRIVMLSDGVIAFGEDWIKNKLALWADESEEEFAKGIISEAKSRRGNNKDDDMSVIPIRLRATGTEG